VVVRFSPDDVERLASWARLSIPVADRGPLAETLAAHLAFVEPLLEANDSDDQLPVTLDPRWRD
jgi:hypothetical protein